MKPQKPLGCLAIGCLAFALLSTAGAVPGAPDHSFSGDGVATFAINNRTEEVLGMALLNDGRAVIAGGFDNTKRSQWFVQAVSPNGSLDRGFGLRTVSAPGDKDDAYAAAVAVQSTGHIVVAGRIHNGADYDAAVARFLPNGQVDSGFGQGGVLIVPISAGAERFTAVTIDSNDRIVLAGFAMGSGGQSDFAVVRLTAEGALDLTFNATGKVITFVSASDDSASAVVTTSDNRVIAVGTSAGTDFAAVRYLENGTPDPLFDSDGIAIVSFPQNSAARAVALQVDEKIVLAGRTSDGGGSTIALTRLQDDGSLDPDFGTSGKVVAAIGSAARANAVAVQTDGTILVAGATAFRDDDFLVARFLPDGTPDLRFQGTGYVARDFGTGNDEAFTLAVRPDGRILVGGGAARPGGDLLNVDPALLQLQGGEGLPVVAPISDASVGAPVNGTPSATISALSVPQPGTFAGSFALDRRKTRALFGQDAMIRLQVGGDFAPIAGSVIATLSEPNGQAALATLKVGAGQVTAANDVVLVAGLDSSIRIAAREGTDQTGFPPGVQIKRIGAFDGQGDVVFFQAILQGAGVTAKSDSALCAALPDGSVKILVREGEDVEDLVTVIATLVPVKGTTAEGRWRAGDSSLGVRLTFKDRHQALFTVPASANSPADWIRWVGTGDTLPSPLAGVIVASLGMPAFGSDGPAVPVTFARENGISSADDQALLRFHAGGVTVLARESGEVRDAAGMISAAKYKALGDVVCGADGRAAWRGKVAGTKMDDGIWWVDSNGAIRQLAREGDAAPGGGTWASFVNLVLPDGVNGPIFLATLKRDAKAEIAANARGLWASDDHGDLRMLLRDGQFVTIDGAPRVVKKFSALAPAAGSLGAASGYGGGTLSVLATFKDGGLSLLRLALP